jgi:hypothetical protein
VLLVLAGVVNHILNGFAFKVLAGLASWLCDWVGGGRCDSTFDPSSSFLLGLVIGCSFSYDMVVWYWVLGWEARWWCVRAPDIHAR